MRKDVYARIYRKLDKLGVVAMIEAGTDAAKSESVGYMDLHFDNLGAAFEGTTEHYAVKVALAHYYEQSGDLCADPDMTLRIFPDHKIAEALSFQMANPPLYQEVYPAPNKVAPKLRRELNAFLDKWLSNCIAQKHGFKMGPSA